MRNPPLIFNDMKPIQSTTHKNLGLILDNRLSFEEYLTAVGAKVKKTMALLRKLQRILQITHLDCYIQRFYLSLS